MYNYLNQGQESAPQTQTMVSDHEREYIDFDNDLTNFNLFDTESLF